jgi:hypothetical protein
MKKQQERIFRKHTILLKDETFAKCLNALRY